MALLFLFFVLLTVGSAALVLLSHNVLYSAYSLLLTFVGLAALYVLAGADFLAVTQLMVYVGGVLVLLVFGVMLTGRRETQDGTEVPSRTGFNAILTRHGRTLAGVLVAGSVFVLLLTAAQKANFPKIERDLYDPIARPTTVPDLGIGLMSTHALPFEVAGILLLAALIGAAYLSKEK